MGVRQPGAGAQRSSAAPAGLPAAVLGNPGFPLAETAACAGFGGI